MPPKFVDSSMFGRVDETNGEKSWPNRAKPVRFSVSPGSLKNQARRMEGWLEQIEDIFRFATLVKSPSKSSSKRPVITVFGAGSSHSKLAPNRSARTLR